MASSLTNKGQEIMLKGTATPNGSIANLATALLLYDSTSVPDKDGTGFVEVANGGGYLTGGIAITTADWTLSLVGSDNQIELDDQVWTASGGGIANIDGAYIINVGGDVLAWWERASPVSLAAGDTLTAQSLTIALT